MATIRAFNGVRFKGSEITKQICPPYDVISPNEKKGLLKLSKNNIVRVELPDETKTKNKYQQAAVVLNDWLDSGVLVKESKPALYFYEQSFKSNGKMLKRRGFFAALKLEDPHKGVVKPHEKTLAKPKQDRLSLLKEVQTNVSPIFGLFNDKGSKIVALSKKIGATKAQSSAKDKYGVVNKLWVVTDEKTIKVVTKALAAQNIFIADGHHRYETAWNYLNEQKNKKGYNKEASYNYVMAFLCPMEDPGLVVWPTHRVVKAPADLESKMEQYFNTVPAASFKKLSAKLPQPILIWNKGKSVVLTVKNSRILEEAMPGRCKAYQELGVSILHSILLKDVLPENVVYVKNDVEAIALAKKTKVMAALVPSTPVDAVKKIANAKETMPQKSTYFYPKVITGMVMHSVKG